MKNKILLKQLILELANKEKKKPIAWDDLREGNILKREADKKDDPLADLANDAGGEADAKAQQPVQQGGQNATQQPAAEPAAGAAKDDAGADAAAQAPSADAAAGAGEENASEEDVEKAQADATKAKAELEKAKAEKDQAEKELEQHSYIKLKSNSGVQFMLGKILNQAFKTNTIDALASEMVQKLNIKTPQDVDAFAIDNPQSKVLVGMPQLIASMKSMATKTAGGEETSEK